MFRRERIIRFSDCDPAGIVFYPQYFVMFNGLLEDWISDGLAVGFGALVLERRIGLPTVRLEVDFSAVSRDIPTDVRAAIGRTTASKQ